jgi:hypothetical protein
MNLRISFLITEVRNLNFVDFILFDISSRGTRVQKDVYPVTAR